jgi:hypothetical protein
MTMPGFTAAASHRATVGRYATVSRFSAPPGVVQPQLDEKDYAGEDPTDPSPPAEKEGVSLLGGGTSAESFFSSWGELFLDTWDLDASRGGTGGGSKAACRQKCALDRQEAMLACSGEDWGRPHAQCIAKAFAAEEECASRC